MSSLFERTLQRAEKHVDKLFADEELFTIYPRVEVRNGTSVVDPDRNITEGIKGIFMDKGTRVYIGQQDGPDRASSSPRISIRDEYLPYDLKTLDRFKRESGGKMYEIESRDPDGLGRTVYVVVEL